jgi:hypothetical protein
MQTGQLGTVGIGSLVLVMFVIMGAVRYVTSPTTRRGFR